MVSERQLIALMAAIIYTARGGVKQNSIDAAIELRLLSMTEEGAAMVEIERQAGERV